MNPGTRMFRQHDVAPTEVVSPLFRQLTQEWAELHAQTSTAGIVRRWGRAEPALAGFTRPGEILDAIDAGDPPVKDELLLALLRLFQDGHQLAGRTVLQAMLPKLTKTATATNPTLCTSMNAWDEDRRHITVAEFWDVMTHYPVHRRPGSVAQNLALETLHRVTAVRAPRPPIPVDTSEPDAPQYRHPHALDPADDPAVAVEGLSVDADLLQVLTWAVSTSALTRHEAHLLATVYLPQKSCGFAATAEELGLSESAVRQRCSRAARKLKAAVRAEMDLPIDTATLGSRPARTA